MKKYQKLEYSEENFLSYYKYSAKKNNKQGIIFFGGFKSNMNGTKAEALKQYSIEKDLDLVLFDYFGHGNSSGNFVDGNIGIWLENCLAMLDKICDDKPQIIIGSSMGGWLMLLAAMQRQKKIKALIGLATAADFTEENIYKNLTDEQKHELANNNIINFKNEFCQDPYPISKNLIYSSRPYLVLKAEIELDMPIRLIHGMEDKDIPYKTSLEIAQRLTSKNVVVHLIKSAEHNLSRPEDLKFIFSLIDELT